jgi:two-component system phosphate regulon response regulator PhoB
MGNDSQPFEGRGLNALIIDDDPFSRKLTRGMLDKLGFDPIWEAGGGEDGFRFAERYGPDVVLLDWIMPGMSGVEALRQLKSESAACRDVPVVVTSECASRETIVETATEGASAVVIKPFATATLGARIVRALSADAPSRRKQHDAHRSRTHGRQHRA